MKTILNIARRQQRGQSLVVAVIVLFVLLFIGGIFVGLVGRNLVNMGRARDTLSAHELARAGIKYAEYFLQHSAEGADWRPAPTPINPAIPAGANDPDRRWLDPALQNPPFSQPTYSRIDFQGGRALVRISYQPRYVADPRNPGQQVLDPLSKLIKIESIGRPGVVDPTDPTTFVNVPEPRLRREYVAYKQVGITDYLRYVTNKENDSKAEAFLGVPPISVPSAEPSGNPALPPPPANGRIVDPLWMQLGKLPVRTFNGLNTTITNPGAPLRINCNLRLPGNVILSADRRNGEQILIAGDVMYDQVTPSALRAKYYDPETGAQPNETALPDIRESRDPAFTSFGGAFRDGDGNPDAQGYARAISVLPPPLLQEEDPASRVTRYRLLTRDSGRWVGPAGNQFNTGRFAMGGGLYIDNRNNQERQSLTVAGAQSLRSLWLNPGSSTEYWKGPFYIPPGAFIEFGYFIVPNRDATDSTIITAGRQFIERPGFRIVRDDRPFRDPNNNIAPSQMVWTFFIYKGPGQRPVLKIENEFFRTYLRTALNMTEQQVDAFLPPFNGVIFAEGNVRVRGMIPALNSLEQTIGGPGDPKLQIRPAGDAAGTQVAPSDPDTQAPNSLTSLQLRKSVDPMSVTVVSGATAYVEGSIVREAPTPWPDNTIPAIPLVTLMAADYVTVNTTLIMAPNKPMPYDATYADAGPPYHTIIDTREASSTPTFGLDFLFGDDPRQYVRDINNPNQSPINLNLLLRHAAPAESSFMSLFVNEAFPTPLYRFNTNIAPFSVTVPPPWVYPLSDPRQQIAPNFEQGIFPLVIDLPGTATLPNNSTYSLFMNPGYRNLIRPTLDLTFTSESGVMPYLFSRAAIAPMDVRIEAVLYAENGSFFVIPGYSLNPNQNDTRDQALLRARAEQQPIGTMTRPAGVSPLYPFHGEPYDCRITVVGAIAENRTAPVADQAAWMQNWGFIPVAYGSTDRAPGAGAGGGIQIPDTHIRIGEAGMPLPGTDIRTQSEQRANVTRGLRFLYDPILHAPYPGYDPNTATTLLNIVDPANPTQIRWAHRLNGAHRQDDYGRALSPGARLPLSPGFVFYGEVR